MKENFIGSEEQMTLLENYFSSNRSEFVAIYGRWRFGKIFLVKELFENQFTFRMTVWQHQQNVSYCLYGSKIHMMTNLFQKKSYPFYKFGELLYLKSIPFEIWLPYIQEGFTKQGKHISEQLVRELCESVDY